MLVLGLTGSIGMGKSTTAQMFRDEGIPVHDADAEVHSLYAGAAIPAVEAAFTGVTRNGVVDRALLRDRVIDDPAAMRRLEAIVHPLVRAARDAFVAAARSRGTALVVLDIPLLFEIGAEREVDRIVVVSAPESVQKARVLARPGMTDHQLSAILAQQISDDEKRRRADWVIDTGLGLEPARAHVQRIIAEAMLFDA